MRDAILYGDKRDARRRRSAPTAIEWEGVLANIERRYDESESDTVRMELQEFMIEVPCSECDGRRLKPEALAVTIARRNIGEVVELPVTEALTFFENVPVRRDGKPGLDPEIAGPILKEVRERLRFLVDVGLDYLTLGRAAESLSGGEAQRIRLATQIGSRLVGVLYILDEPSIGLHQRDNARLLATLEQLRDLGNTVIVVEHDEETMRAADHVIDLGPGRGEARRRGHRRRHGRRDHAQPGVDHRASISSGELKIPMPATRRPFEPHRTSFASRARASTTCATSTSRFRSDCSSRSPACRARASRR